MKNHTHRILTSASAGLLILVFLSSCTLGDTLPANTAVPLPTLPTGQAGGLAPADQLTPEPFITLPSIQDAPTSIPTSNQDNVPAPTPTTPTKIELVDFYNQPRYIDAGGCTTIYWEVTGTKEGIYLNGELVPPKGSTEYCTCFDELLTLEVVAPDGTRQKRISELYVNKNTNCIDSVPEDTEGPVIGTLGKYMEDCEFYAYAVIRDQTGIAEVKFGFNLNNQGWQWLKMNYDAGTDYWEPEERIPVMEGIGTPIGHIDYQFWAKDTLGNETYSDPYPYDYNSCSD